MAPDVFTKERGVVAYRRDWLWPPVIVATLLLFFMPTFNILPKTLQGVAPTWTVVLVFSASVVLPFLSVAFSWRSSWGEVAGVLVRADGEGVRVASCIFLPRRSIRSAHIVTRDDHRVRVRIDRRIFPIEIDVESVTEARLLLRALHFGDHGFAERYTMGVGRRHTRRLLLGATIVVCAVVASFYSRSVENPWRGGIVLCAVGLALSRLRLCEVSVGDDGISIRCWTGHNEFVPYRNMKTIDRNGADIRIHVAGSSPIIAHRLWLEPDNADRVMDRANRRLGAERDGSGDANRRQPIQPQDPSGPYRLARADPEELLRITTDPTSDACVRVAAALALRQGLTDVGRLSMRNAADASANWRLKSALHAIASSVNEARLARVLRRLHFEYAPLAARNRREGAPMGEVTPIG